MNAVFPAIAIERPSLVKPRPSAAWLVVALTALALAVRLAGLDLRPLWLDEAYSAWFSTRGWHELWAVVPTYEPHPPFYYSVLKLWRGLWGGSEIALRAFSVICAVATVPVVAAAVREQERQDPSPRPSLRIAIAGILVACSPMLVLLGQEARPYPLLILAYAVAVLALLRLFRQFACGGPGRWGSWLLLGGGIEIVLWSHGLGPLYAIALAAALLPAWLSKPTRARIWRGIAVGAAVAIVYAPCLAMIVARAGDWGSGWLKWEPAMVLLLLTLYSIPFELLGVVTGIAAIAMLLLLKRACDHAMAGRGWTGDKALLVAGFGPALMAAAISFLFMPVFLPRALAGAMIPAYLAMAGALARTEVSRERMLIGGALAASLLVGAMQVALRPANEQWREVAAYLDRNVGPSDQVWLYPNDSALPLAAAGWNNGTQTRALPDPYPAVASPGLVRAGSPAVKSLTPEQARAAANDPALARIPTIWLLARQSDVIDPAGDLPRELARVRRPGPERQWGIISVRAYTPR
ncbi:hypothetical protein G7078_01780 [Sphingomonas sinipercae]|uniref:Uncharacterized protein n=1 Tax=Sphingomonas sinipercae TaxID=2714944 RepID=A0A6G7ZL29_9SPHN|nr:glycosyltransferase family 39 protein [Sphingomonas sinipercae]QIL01643.1 hypothetical protein G7078_01780 [Sphingomonas sinipercae]